MMFKKILCGCSLAFALAVSVPATALMDFTFNSSLSPSPLNPLWTFTYDGIAYSFVTDRVDVGSPRTSSLPTLLGRGTLYVTGFDSTPGIWEITSRQALSAFIKFTSKSSSLPEPGSLALLGLGLLGFGLGRRRRT